mmetsp:Transcript_23385/g.92699  ORF Transcript_23385/g.92699 Transcript_23385/m.92699 type:complete len:302 (+) Transcript_23385:78-983(+)
MPGPPFCSPLASAAVPRTPRRAHSCPAADRRGPPRAPAARVARPRPHGPAQRPAAGGRRGLSRRVWCAPRHHRKQQPRAHRAARARDAADGDSDVIVDAAQRLLRLPARRRCPETAQRARLGPRPTRNRQNDAQVGLRGAPRAGLSARFRHVAPRGARQHAAHLRVYAAFETCHRAQERRVRDGHRVRRRSGRRRVGVFGEDGTRRSARGLAAARRRRGAHLAPRTPHGHRRPGRRSRRGAADRAGRVRDQRRLRGVLGAFGDCWRSCRDGQRLRGPQTSRGGPARRPGRPRAGLGAPRRG